MLKNILALLIGLAVALIFAEIALQIFNPFEFRVKGNKIVLPINKKYEINNTSNIPNMDQHIMHSKNSLGFRGKEKPKDYDNYLSIIAIGGSTTECFYLSDKKTWPALLEKKLNNEFNKIWLNNAGLDGHSTFGHILLMEDYIIPKIKPDIALFFVGGTDFFAGENANHHDQELKIGISTNSMKKFIGSLANYSEVMSLSLNLYRYIKAKNSGMTQGNNIVPLNLEKLPRISNKERKSHEILKQKYSSAINGYRVRLEKLIKITTQNNIYPVLVTHPALWSCDTDLASGVNLTNIKTADLSWCNNWTILDWYNDITRKTAIKHNVFLIDLAAKLPHSSDYYYDDSHFNNIGADKAATIIHDELIEFLSNHYPKHINVESK